MRLFLALLVAAVDIVAQPVPPQLLSETKIEYTETARIAHIEGSVGVMCDVDRRGKPINIRITKALEPSLDRQVIEAVAHWQFRPGIRNGKNATWKNVSFEIPFALPKEPAIPPQFGTVLACVIAVCGVIVLLVMSVAASRRNSSSPPLPPETPLLPQPAVRSVALIESPLSINPKQSVSSSRPATGTAVLTAPYIVPAKVNLHKEVPRQYVVFDLETTGLAAAQSEIIEIGAILVDRDATANRFFQTLVKPTKRIPSHITEINGITNRMVTTSGLPLDWAMTEFLAFTDDLPLIAYNASFDMDFLWAAANRYHRLVPNRYTCAMKMARRAWPTLVNHKLDTVSRSLRFRPDSEDEGTHRAVGDCRRTVHIYQAAAEVLGMRFL